VLIVGGATAILKEFGARSRVDVRRGLAENWDRYGASFLADQVRASALDATRLRAGPIDANPPLAPRVRWVGFDNVPRRWIVNETPDVAPLSEAMVARLTTPQWVTVPIDDEMRSVNLDWMRELPAMDFWDVEAAGPRAECVSFPCPTPERDDVLAWARLRLLRASESRLLQSALDETRALARLAITSEDFALTGVGVRILRLEDELRASLESSGVDVSAWTPPPDADRVALRHALIGATSLHDIDGPEAAHRITQAEAPVGWCAALNEQEQLAWFLRPLIADRYVDDYARLDAAASSSTCRLTLVRRNRERDPPNAATLLCQKPGVYCVAARVGAALPFVRADIGDVVRTIAVSMGVGAYASRNGHGGASPEEP
jgi:hypothetical protein